MMVSVGTGMFNCTLGTFAAPLSLTVVAMEVEGDGASVGTGRVGSFSGLFLTSSAVEVEGVCFAGASFLLTVKKSGSPCLFFNSCAVNNK